MDVPLHHIIFSLAIGFFRKPVAFSLNQLLYQLYRIPIPKIRIAKHLSPNSLKKTNLLLAERSAWEEKIWVRQKVKTNEFIALAFVVTLGVFNRNRCVKFSQKFNDLLSQIFN